MNEVPELTKREAAWQVGLAAVIFAGSALAWSILAWAVASWVLGSGPV